LGGYREEKRKCKKGKLPKQIGEIVEERRAGLGEGSRD